MRGDVVIIDYPFGDAGGSKIRPALVVQADGLASVNVAMVLITSNTVRVGPSRLLVDPAGLRVPSVVTCDNLYSPHRDRIIRTIGRLPSATMAQIDACLKAALGLP